ncbi:MAG: 5-(carboxyamino)imidazole ribonucleotide mutase [Candidatus Hydrogenedentota bacterium]
MSEQDVPQVGVVMGSKNDWDTMSRAHDVLTEFEVPHECRVFSAHRTPEALAQWVQARAAGGCEAFIAGAGGAAALPGAVAALTTVPVLGVPVLGWALSGEDALYAMAQMPPGIPVGTLAIGKPGATNAALLAIAILANTRPELREKLAVYRKKQADQVLAHKLPCAD